MRHISVMFVVLVFSIPTFVASQTEKKTTADFGIAETSLFKLMQANYVGMDSVNVYTNKTEYKMTGIAITPHDVITAFHAIKEDHKIVLDGEREKDDAHAEGRLAIAFPEMDVAVIRFKNVTFSPNIMPVHAVAVSQPLFTIANERGQGATFYRLYISKIKSVPTNIKGARLLMQIQVHPAVIPGVSGAGVYNSAGKLVGMIVGDTEVAFGGSTIPAGGIILPVPYLEPIIKQALSIPLAQ